MSIYKKGKWLIFSLGGSIIVPACPERSRGNKIDVKFLKKFKKIILNLIKSGYKIVIITGGGGLSRQYNQAAKKISKINDLNLDWLGIAATKLNAELLRVIFSQHAYPKVIDNPNYPITKAPNHLIIASGWKPGCSTDKDAVLWAKKFGAEQIINLTNIDFVYDKDPRKFPNAKPMKNIRWLDYRKIVGSKWSPRLSTPFDPIASKLAQKYKIKVIILNGRNLKNIVNYLRGKKFNGTIIGQ